MGAEIAATFVCFTQLVVTRLVLAQTVQLGPELITKLNEKFVPDHVGANHCGGGGVPVRIMLRRHDESDIAAPQNRLPW